MDSRLRWDDYRERMDLIPTVKAIQMGSYKQRYGIWFKLCTGPAHEGPIWLPATTKYFYFRKTGKQAGRPVARCRLCHQWNKLKSPGSLHGYVPVEKVLPFYTEAINRIGMTELSRRARVSLHHLGDVVMGKQKVVQKATLRKVMLELVSIQRKNEYLIEGRTRWRTERRNSNGLETCAGCGTPKRNYTAGCDNCWQRGFDLFKRKKITKEEWQKIRLKFDKANRNSIHGVEVVAGSGNRRIRS